MKNRITIKIVFGLIGMLISLFTIIGGSSNTYAATEKFQAITAYKGLYQGLYRCYKNGSIKSDFGALSNYKDIDSLLTSGAKSAYDVYIVRGFSDGKNNFKHGAIFPFDLTVSCKQLFDGYSPAGVGSLTGVLKANGKSAPSANEKAETISDFMKNMGYEVTSGENGKNEKCYSLRYNDSGITNKVCQDSDGKITTQGDDKSRVHFSMSVANGNNTQHSDICLYAPDARGNSKSWGCRPLPGKDKLNGSYLMGVVTALCGEKTCKDTNERDGVTVKYVFQSSKEDINNTEDASSSNYNAKLMNPSTKAGLQALNYITDGKYANFNSIKIGNVETRVLYQAYLTSYYNVKVSCKSGEDDSAYDGTVKWLFWDTGQVKECHYEDNNAKYKNDHVNKVSDGILVGSINNYKDLIKAINALSDKYTEEELAAFRAESGQNPTASSEDEGEGSNVSSSSICYEGSGALGWILCPIIKGLSAAGGRMWEVVSGILNIPANETFKGNNGVLIAWEAIRNIANVIFIVLLLVVIFSQLTGVGIDNYGIKRVLPKMIIAAVLINLSYVICELAVDISNILGNSLEGLFVGQAGLIDLGAEYPGGSEVAAGMVGVALASGGTYLFTLLNNPLGIVAVGIAVVSIIIAIVTAIAFMYLILVIRQAGVILMVVLAPAAIVCYMLPNTEKIYKRWFDAFKALLLVYPICGAIVGAGQLASAVLGSIDNTAMKIAAMIVQVVPFFLIPTLLRNSLSLMGNIGQRLQNVAGRARRGATGVAGNAMRNSEMLKSFDNRLGMHSISSRRRAAAVESQGAIMAARGRRERLSDRGNIQTRLRSIAAAEESKAYDEEVSQGLSLMQSAGEYGGIVMGDGTRKEYSRDNMEARMKELELASRTRELTNREKSQVSILARGLGSEPGGASKLNDIVRGAGNGNLNSNFLNALGNSYTQDATVRNAMNEKDDTMGAYMERFMPGADRSAQESYADYQSNGHVEHRAKSYEAKLKQGGQALKDYIGTLDANACQNIYDTDAYKVLDANDLDAFQAHAKLKGVTGKSASDVHVV